MSKITWSYKGKFYCSNCTMAEVFKDGDYCSHCVKEIMDYLYKDQDTRYLKAVAVKAEAIAYSDWAQLSLF